MKEEESKAIIHSSRMDFILSQLADERDKEQVEYAFCWWLVILPLYYEHRNSIIPGGSPAQEKIYKDMVW